MSLFGPKPFGLALGSGGARGFAHVGVLKGLEAAGLRPDIITGTSIGAVVGAFYAAGHSVAEIEELARAYDTRQLAGISEVALRRGAVLSGEKLEEFLRAHLPATFEELHVPFGCVATDLTRNCPVQFTAGDLVTAVRASASVPIVFLPVRMNEMLLVDGDVSDPVPVALARQMGARVVAAVEVCGSGVVHLSESEQPAGSLVRDLRAAIRGERNGQRGTTALEIAAAVYEAFEGRAAQPALDDADLVISPDVHELASFEFLQAERMIAAGESAAIGAAPELRRKARR